MPRQDIFGIQELPEQLIITSAGFLRLLSIRTYIQRERTNMSCAYNMTDENRQSLRFLTQDISPSDIGTDKAVLGIARKLNLVPDLRYILNIVFHQHRQLDIR
jgi:hypothetical protein